MNLYDYKEVFGTDMFALGLVGLLRSLGMALRTSYSLCGSLAKSLLAIQA